MFPLTADADGSEARSEANAAVDACNKANVAIYPIDVRGLGAGLPGVDSSMPGRGRAALEFPRALPGLAWRSSGIALAASPVLRIASFFLSAAEWEQAGRGGGGSSGGGSVGSPGGGTTSRGGSSGSTGGGNTGTGSGTTRGTPGSTGTSGTRNPAPTTNPNPGRSNNINNLNNPNNPNSPLYNGPSRLSIPRFPPSATEN